MSDFHSRLAPHIERFLSYREALFHTNGAYRPALANLDRFCADMFPDEDSLTQEMVVIWMKNRLHEHSAGLQVRAGIIRQFGDYLNGMGECAYVLPPKYVGGNSSFCPYIFTDAELKALFSAIDNAYPP